MEKYLRSAVITGIAGGIGRALEQAFLKEGYKVIGLDCDTPGNPDWLNVDLSVLVRSPEVRDHFLPALLKRLDGQLDVLINNAAYQVVKPLQDISLEDWQRSLDINLTASFLLTQTLTPLLKAAGGSVINIGSIHANLTKPHFSAYATSKGALHTLTRALAVELAPEIRVNAIAPAATDTLMLRSGLNNDPKLLAQLGGYHPMQRIAAPEEIAATALFLSSPAAGFITGSILGVDGAISARLHDPE